MPASTRRPQVAVGSPCWIVVGRTEYPASVVASRGDGKVLVRWSTTFEDHAKWVRGNLRNRTRFGQELEERADEAPPAETSQVH